MIIPALLFSLNNARPEEDSSGGFVLWAFADIQPRNRTEEKSFENAVSDIEKNNIYISAAIAGGDMVQMSSSSDPDKQWQWFYDSIRPLNIKHLYEIIGNHDARNIPAYFRYTGKPLHYSVRFGNLIIILLSDEKNSSGTDISDKAFFWWKDVVESNQDKIIITVTHSHLGGTGFAYNFPRYRNVMNSERFTEVLRKNRVDFWLFGHTHVPYILKGKERKLPQLNNTLFINIAAIREDYFLSSSESRFFYFQPGSENVIIKTRDHGKNKFVDSIELKVKLKYKFVYNGEEPEINSFRN